MCNFVGSFAQTTIQGDLNKDDQLNVADVILLKKTISSQGDIPNLRICDVNHDNKLNDKDVSAMEDCILNDSVISYSFAETFPSTTKTGLPIVLISTPNNVEITSKENWIEGAYMLVVDEKGDTIYDGFMDIKGRGNSTWGQEKKPYNIKLASKSKILGMPKHKRWCLLSSNIDKSLIRNCIAFEIAKRTGLAWTPRGQHVEVVMNGQHIGYYYLCEHLKIDENRINIREMSSEDEEEDITGGYHVEVDKMLDEENQFVSSIRKLPYMFKEPDADVLTSKQFEYFKSYIDTLEHTLYDEGRILTHEYEKYMDVESFIDYWIVYELTNNWQLNSLRSVHLHKDRNGKLTAGPVWDFDYDTFATWTSEMLVNKVALYYDALFKDPSFVLKLKERWNMFKHAFETIPTFILEEKNKIVKSQSYNYSIWTIPSMWTDEVNMPLNTVIDRIIRNYNTKLSFMDKEINNM